MSITNISMLKKILISTLPILFGTVFVSWTVEKMAFEVETEVTKAVQMTDLVNQAELEMVKMSESLRGYLLKPDDKSEFKRKKDADEAYQARSHQLSELVGDDKEIFELNEKMTKFDETDLDRIENEVGELIEKKDPKALEYYVQTYSPARASQSADFAKLKDLVFKKSQKILAEMESRKRANAHFTVALLLISVFFGISIMVWVTAAVVKTIQKISHGMSGNVSEVDEVANKMAESSGKLSESAALQASSIQETTASLEEITSMVAVASESAQKSAESATLTEQKATAGKQSMESMLSAIDEINSGNHEIIEQVKYSNDQMSQVIQVINEIGNKTKVINEIVFQTKLLSFNASVEAARAGEQGKGFAVVAEEVGSLAQMSGNAAKEISDMLAISNAKVQEIVRDSQDRVQSLMSKVQSRVERGVSVAQQCNESLEEIVTHVGQVTGLAQEISNATKEQFQGLREISKAMNQLDNSTQMNAATSDEAAQAAESLTNQTELLRDASTDLIQAIMGGEKNHSPQKQSNVKQFKTATQSKKKAA